MAEQQRIPVGPVGPLIAANILAVLGFVVFAVLTAGQLPARYPSHFNAAGLPDRWSESGGLGWYALPITALALAAAMVALALLLPRLPMSLVNIPRKEQFLRLSAAERAPLIQFLIRYLLWVALADTLLFLSIQWLMYRSALEGRVDGDRFILLAAALLYVGLLLWGVVRIYRMVREATDRLEAGAPPALG